MLILKLYTKWLEMSKFQISFLSLQFSVICNFFAPKIRKCDKIVVIDAETKPGRGVLNARLSDRNHEEKEGFDDHRN